MSQVNGTKQIAPEAETSPRPLTSPALPAPAAVHKPIYRRPAGIILLAIVVVAGILGAAYWFYAQGWENTDDAFIDGNVIPVGTKVAGSISSVLVKDNQTVKAGDVLAEIDPRDFQAKLAQTQAMLEAARADAEAAKTHIDLTRANTAAMLSQAQAGVESATAAVATANAQLASAQADVTSAQAESTRRDADEKRYTGLDPRGVSQAQLDAIRASADAAAAQLLAAQKRVIAAQAGVSEAKSEVAAAQGVLASAKTAPQQIAAAESKSSYAQAQVGLAQAQVDAAALDLSYTTIKAPISGQVTRKNVQPGQYVQRGQTLLAVVPPDFWVTANFKETQLTHMRVGQSVDVSIDAFPDHTFHGRIQSIQAGTGAQFSMLPPENATGNYVKVVQRVPVKIVFDGEDISQYPLGSGMSVVPEVNVGETPSSTSVAMTQNTTADAR